MSDEGEREVKQLSNGWNDKNQMHIIYIKTKKLRMQIDSLKKLIRRLFS